MGRHLVYKSVTSHEHDIPTDLQDLQAFAQQVKSDYLALEARHKAEIQNRDMMITKLRHQLFGLRKDKFGSSGEGLDQLGLRLEDEETGQELNIATTESDVAEETVPKVKPVRRALPKHLPRTDVKHMPDAPCAGCGSELDDGAKTLGEDVMEELEYVPGRFVVNRIIRPRLSCAACETISQAPMPSRPIPKSYAGPGLLASIIVGKYADHLPLYRQSQIMAREGIDIDRSTLAGWVGRSAHMLERLSDKIRDHVMGAPALFADDTTIKLLAPGNGKTKTARLWIYSRDERAWNGSAPQAAWYQFSPDRKGKRTEAHLSGYTGFIHADGYAGFNKLYGHEKAKEMACMAHIRRKFVDIFEAQGSAIAGEAIERIAQLYKIEKQVRGSPPDERVAMRQKHSKAILDDLESWLSKQLTHISGKSRGCVKTSSGEFSLEYFAQNPRMVGLEESLLP